MATSEVQICNMALGHIGHSKTIGNLETDRSVEAGACNLYYEEARNYVLEGFPWPFAAKVATLGLVEEDPTEEWEYSYRYPSDCLFARRLVTNVGRANPTPPPFVITSDDTARLIYTNEQDAVLEYTRLVEDPLLFPASFAQALSWWLAGLIAPALAKDRKMAESCMKTYLFILSQAEARAGNEQQQEVEPESEMMRARD